MLLGLLIIHVTCPMMVDLFAILYNTALQLGTCLCSYGTMITPVLITGSMINRKNIQGTAKAKIQDYPQKFALHHETA